ncbi:MAG: rhodanese-like domain-containing protein [Luteimonas sp.]
MNDATPIVLPLEPAGADARARDGSITVVDVRPPAERALAEIARPYVGLEDGGLERLLALPKQSPLAFLCHHGVRSAQAAEYFRAQGFDVVYNIVGGIEAWACELDSNVARY